MMTLNPTATEMISLGPKSPEAWFLPEKPEDDMDEEYIPALVAEIEDLRDHGVSCWKVDSDLFASPIMPSNAEETATQSSQYANVIEMSPEHFPQHSLLFDGRKPCEVLCYVLVGSSTGFLDVCSDGTGRWIRIHVKNGDLITLPEDLYHRFTPNEKCPASLVRIVLA